MIMNCNCDFFPLRCFVVGSKDMSTWVFGAERWANLIYYSLGGHKDVIVGCFFEKDSLDVSLVLPSTMLWFRLKVQMLYLHKKKEKKKENVNTGPRQHL